MLTPAQKIDEVLLPVPAKFPDELKKFHVGEEVEFHNEWPFYISYGVVKEVGVRQDNHGGASYPGSVFITADWEADPYGISPAHTGTTDTWNGRLRKSTRVRTR